MSIFQVVEVFDITSERIRVDIANVILGADNEIIGLDIWHRIIQSNLSMASSEGPVPTHDTGTPVFFSMNRM